MNRLATVNFPHGTLARFSEPYQCRQNCRVLLEAPRRGARQGPNFSMPPRPNPERMKPMSRAVRHELKHQMRPELALVVCCLRPPSTENDSQLRVLLREKLDWNEVLACAHQHKVGPFVQERLGPLGEPWIAPDQKARLAALSRDLGRNNLAYMGDMLWLCRLFETAGIPVFPFKGPALAWLAYRNFAHRTCVDLDFVLPQRYIPDATSLLQAHGYTPEFSPAEAQAGDRGPAPGQYAFIPGGTRRYVELHTERTFRYFSRPLNLDELNSRAIPLRIGAQNVRVFSVEDLLVMLCVHGAKHFWERLAWIVDIGQLITAREVDWALLLGIAEKMKSTRLLLLGLDLAHEVAGVTLPQPVLERATGDPHVVWLAGKVIEQYSGTSDPSAGVFHRAVFRLRSCDGLRQGLRQLFRLSLSPTEIDRQAVRLPGFLFVLYALVRPFRLLGKYGLGLIRRPKPDLAIYDPTPPEVVEHMLSLANVSPGDVLYDLGCGDGRIVVAAAEKYGIRAVGVDIDSSRIAEARANARRRGVEDRVEFLLSDVKHVNLSEATIVALYLETPGVLRLAHQLRSQLRRGARIVSRSAQIYGWNPDRSETHALADGTPTELYLWAIQGDEDEAHVSGDEAPELPQTHKAGT
jgi:hypothetical protein